MASDCVSPRSSDSPPAELCESLSSNVSNNKSVWNKPCVVEVSPVMGALSWPPLSVSAKGSPKSSSDSLKTLSVGSVSASASASPQPPLVAANACPSPTSNHQFPIRQGSFNKSVGVGGSSNGPSSQLTVEVTQNLSTKPTPVVLGASPKDSPHKKHGEGGQRTGMVSQSHKGNDHQHNSSRRGGSGHHRGDGSNHYNHGKRRDQLRPNHESNVPHQGFNGRDGHFTQRVDQRNFARSMQQSTPFVSPPPIPPFGNPLGFPDMTYYVPSPNAMRGVPFFHAAPFAMILPAPDPQLRTVLAKQIEFYFSPENLCKDIFLRKHMDAEGWVIISLIANFNRVKQLTNSTQFILDSLWDSKVVEVQGDKIRKRNDWMNWTLVPSQPDSTSDPLSGGIDHDSLVSHMKIVGLEEADTVT